MGHGRGEPLRGGIYPSQKLLDWAQGLDLYINAGGAREPCQYLIPEYETEEKAEEILEEVYEAIFEAELDFWRRDTGTWPAERTSTRVPQIVRSGVYPLIQDLVGEELTTQLVEPFQGEV